MLSTASIEKPKSTPRTGPYRVMVVDDSAVIRGMISRWLTEEPTIEVVGTAGNGERALKFLEEYDPEIVILDIEMPVMDGLTALPLILKAQPDVQIIMASTLTTKNAQISLQALNMGAAEYVAKPETQREVTTSQSFQQELIGKVVSLASSKRLQTGGQAYKAKTRSLVDSQFNLDKKKASPISVKRNLPIVKPNILAVGSSTGGPQALLSFLMDIKDDLKIPVVITQHMPATFTKILAEHLTRATGLDCAEAKEGDIVEAGKVYIAPGDYHMNVDIENGKAVLRLNQEAPENFCRPAVDQMFRSISKSYGNKVLSVILTGMGQDGLEGSKLIVEGGGSLIAQDEETSVVWGMPGVVSAAGLCNAVLPLDKIGGKVKQIIAGGGV